MAKKRSAKPSKGRIIPTQTDVAFRSLALLGLLGRTEGEMKIQQNPEVLGEWTQTNKRLNHWFKDEGIAPHRSTEEKQLLSKKLGEWTESLVFEMIWKTESLATLLWALGKLTEMPVYSQAVDSTVVFKKNPIMASTKDFLRSIKLRPRKTIEAERDAAEFWHWRARTESLRRAGFTPPPGDTFAACIQRAAESAVERGIVAKTVAGDVPARGKSYGKLTDRQFADAHSVAVERHYALNWLCGYSENGDWDMTRTDT